MKYLISTNAGLEIDVGNIHFLKAKWTIRVFLIVHQTQNISPISHLESTPKVKAEDLLLRHQTNTRLELQLEHEI